MRVSYIISNLPNEGPVNQLLNQIKTDNKTEYIIITLFNEQKGSKKGEFEDLGVEIHSLGYVNKIQVFLPQIKLAHIMKDIRPDIIHSASLPGDIAVRHTKRNGIPWVCTMHCNIFTDYKMGFKPKAAKYNVMAHMDALRNTDVIVACSYYLLNIYKAINYTVCIQNGVDTVRFSPVSDREKRMIRGKLNIPLDKTIMIVSGSVDDRKNTKWIIDALNQIVKELDLLILFIGEGPLLEQCKKEVENIPYFRFEGKVVNVEQYLRCADIYLSASKSEGLPLSVLEGMSCGLPLILSDIPQHKEIVSGNENPFLRLFRLDDSLDMVKEVKKLVCLLKDNEFCVTSLNCQKVLHKKTEDNFSNEVMSKKYIQLYESIKENQAGDV